MSVAKHTDQVASAIGVLEALADGSDESEAGTFSAAADVLRSYADSLDGELVVEYPGAMELHHFRSTVVVLSGKATHYASEDQRRVLQRAVGYLDERVQRVDK